VRGLCGHIGAETSTSSWRPAGVLYCTVCSRLLILTSCGMSALTCGNSRHGIYFRWESYLVCISELLVALVTCSQLNSPLLPLYMCGACTCAVGSEFVVAVDQILKANALVMIGSHTAVGSLTWEGINGPSGCHA
jgi:hypothetical protein